MDISILIVNYHSAAMVADCIRSVREKTEGLTYEIIVVDNASDDGSVEALRRDFGDSITLIPSETNLGFGKANNLAAKQAVGKYLFLLNPDTLLINNAMKILFDYLEANPSVGVAGGNLYAPDMTPAPSFCLHFDELKRERRAASWGAILGGKLRDKLLRRPRPQKEFNHTDKPLPVAYIFGADMLLPRKVFEEVGGFDPAFFMYGEEEELTRRIAQRGYGVICLPDAKIIHLEGATLKAAHAFSEKQFKMRMHGALTYYTLCFGREGAEAFYRLRGKRYDRLTALAKVQGKLTDDTVSYRQRRYLDEVYQAFTLQEGGPSHG